MQETLREISLWALPNLLAVVFHEVAHGWVANALGDPTAKERGRLTLNPLAHVDPIGTIVLPLFLVVTNSGFLFGWAKPVPVDYGNLRNPRRDMILIAAAGPATNVLIASIAAVALHSLRGSGLESTDAMTQTVLYPLALIAEYAVLMNVFLGVFNMIPIPPLDGGRVLTGLLPLSVGRHFARIEPFGFLILLVLLATDSLGVFLRAPIYLLLGALL